MARGQRVRAPSPQGRHSSRDKRDRDRSDNRDQKRRDEEDKRRNVDSRKRRCDEEKHRNDADGKRRNGDGKRRNDDDRFHRDDNQEQQQPRKKGNVFERLEKRRNSEESGSSRPSRLDSHQNDLRQILARKRQRVNMSDEEDDRNRFEDIDPLDSLTPIPIEEPGRRFDDDRRIATSFERNVLEEDGGGWRRSGSRSPIRSQFHEDYRRRRYDMNNRSPPARFETSEGRSASSPYRQEHHLMVETERLLPYEESTRRGMSTFQHVLDFPGTTTEAGYIDYRRIGGGTSPTLARSFESPPYQRPLSPTDARRETSPYHRSISPSIARRMESIFGRSISPSNARSMENPHQRPGSPTLARRMESFCDQSGSPTLTRGEASLYQRSLSPTLARRRELSSHQRSGSPTLARRMESIYNRSGSPLLTRQGLSPYRRSPTPPRRDNHPDTSQLHLGRSISRERAIQMEPEDLNDNELSWRMTSRESLLESERGRQFDQIPSTSAESGLRYQSTSSFYADESPRAALYDWERDEMELRLNTSTVGGRLRSPSQQFRNRSPISRGGRSFSPPIRRPPRLTPSPPALRRPSPVSRPRMHRSPSPRERMKSPLRRPPRRSPSSSSRKTPSPYSRRGRSGSSRSPLRSPSRLSRTVIRESPSPRLHRPSGRKSPSPLRRPPRCSPPSSKRKRNPPAKKGLSKSKFIKNKPKPMPRNIDQVLRDNQRREIEAMMRQQELQLLTQSAQANPSFGLTADPKSCAPSDDVVSLSPSPERDVIKDRCSLSPVSKAGSRSSTSLSDMEEDNKDLEKNRSSSISLSTEEEGFKLESNFVVEEEREKAEGCREEKSQQVLENRSEPNNERLEDSDQVVQNDDDDKEDTNMETFEKNELEIVGREENSSFVETFKTSDVIPEGQEASNEDEANFCDEKHESDIAEKQKEASSEVRPNYVEGVEEIDGEIVEHEDVKRTNSALEQKEEKEMGTRNNNSSSFAEDEEEIESFPEKSRYAAVHAFEEPQRKVDCDSSRDEEIETDSSTVREEETNLPKIHDSSSLCSSEVSPTKASNLYSDLEPISTQPLDLMSSVKATTRAMPKEVAATRSYSFQTFKLSPNKTSVLSTQPMPTIDVFATSETGGEGNALKKKLPDLRERLAAMTSSLREQQSSVTFVDNKRRHDQDKSSQDDKRQKMSSRLSDSQLGSSSNPVFVNDEDDDDDDNDDDEVEYICLPEVNEEEPKDSRSSDLRNFINKRKNQMTSEKAASEKVEVEKSKTTPSKNKKKDNRAERRKRKKEAEKSVGCVCCSAQGHSLRNCPTFVKMKPTERLKVVENSRLTCIKCLKYGHRVTDCDSYEECLVVGCNWPHHTFLHKAYEDKKPVSYVAKPLAKEEDSIQEMLTKLRRQPVIPTSSRDPRIRKVDQVSQLGIKCCICKGDHHVRFCPDLFCQKCETKGHFTNECPNLLGVVCFQCKGSHMTKNCHKSCRLCRTMDHSSEDCPNIICTQCGGKHHIKRCPEAYCASCKLKGHLIDDCPNPYCQKCEADGHLTKNCQVHPGKYCQYCKKSDHVKQDCKEPKCAVCLKYGHVAQDCTNITCNSCKKTGHLIKDCPNPYCEKCETSGHLSKNCQVHPGKFCLECKQDGHISRQCPTRCFLCHKFGHSYMDCPDSNVKGIVCFSCGGEHYKANCPNAPCISCKKPGHLLNDCPSPYCPRCETSGHLSKNCKVHPGTFCIKCKSPTHRTNDCSVASCSVCKAIGHTFQDCPDLASKGVVCHECEGNHHVKNCPVRLCTSCSKQGHRSTDCPEPFCNKCQSEGHIPKNCLLHRTTCIRCKGKGHLAQDCPIPSCTICLTIGHAFQDCPNLASKGVVCHNCGESHHIKNCPQRVCKICHETGHQYSDCPDASKGIRCFKCDMFGHAIQNCPFVECKNCGASGHWIKDCTNKKNEFRRKNLPVQEEMKNVVSIDYHHTNPTVASLSIEQPSFNFKPLMTHFYEKLLSRGRNPELAGQMMLYWRLAEHNETTLRELYHKHTPCTRDTLRLLLVSELANAPSSCRPMDVTSSDLLDETIDYFMPRLEQHEVSLPSKFQMPAILGTSSSTMFAASTSSSTASNSLVNMDKAAEGRFKSLQPLQEYIAKKMRSLSSMFGIQESYIVEVSTTIQHILAEVGLCLFTLRRHYTTFGKESLGETIEEKIAGSRTKLPERVSGAYVVAIVSDFLNDFCK